MSYRTRAYGISFLIHLLIFALMLPVFRHNLHETQKLVEIDLSTIEFEKRPQPVQKETFHTLRRHNLPQEKPAQKAQPSISPPPRKAYHSEVQASAGQTQQGTTSQEEPATTNALSSTSENAPRGTQTSENPPPQTSTVAEKPPQEPSPTPQQKKEQYLKEKLHVISQIVQKNITYPPIARRMGWEGRVVLIIRLCQDGTLKEVRVAESSGYEVLDRNAVETVKRVAHLFPRPPVEVVVKLPVNYRLE